MKRKLFLLFSFVVIIFATLTSLPLNKSEKLTGAFPKELEFWQNLKGKNIKKGLDLQGGSRIIYEAQYDQLEDELSSDEKKDRMEIVRDKIERRVNAYGVSESRVYTIGNDKVGVEMPGVDDPTEIINQIGQTGQLFFIKFSAIEDQQPEVLPIEPSDVKKTTANSQTDQLGNVDYVINFKIDGQGKEIFRAATEELAGTGGRIGIYLDDQELFNGTVQSAITDGEGIMTGFEDYKSADRIAKTIEEGALPVPMQIGSQSQIEASLGEDALGKMITAGMIAFLIISILMVLIFKFPGFVAVFDLFAYTVITIAIFKLFGVVLTLAGIAGFLLSVGMELDSSILFFSRVKEEIRKAKSVPVAVTEGFGSAWSAIKDSNVAAIITGITLFYFGTPQVKGFATTLVIGLLTTLFTSIFLTRELMEYLSGFKIFQNTKLFGVSDEEIESVEQKADKLISNEKTKLFKPLKFTKVFLLVTGLLITSSFVFGLIPHSEGSKLFGQKTGIALGTEFKGGSNLDITTDSIKEDEISTVFSDLDVRDVEITQIDEGYNVKFETVSNDKKDEIVSDLKVYDQDLKISFETIGRSLSKEIFTNSLLAVLISSILVIGYLAYAFRKVPSPTKPWQFGLSAIIALVHDVIVLTGFYIILTRITDSRFDSLYITAFLSVVGFSVSDTIVVFDRVREKLLSGEKFENFKDLVNESISSTFTRSLLTGLSAQVVLFSIFLFGVHEVQNFALTMFVGILLGTYSSIVVASVSLVWLNKLGSRNL